MTTNSNFTRPWAIVALLFGLGTIAAVGALQPSGTTVHAQGVPFADPAFKRVWERTDLPVAQGKVNRTWMWGPIAGVSRQEPFREGPGGSHLVQYFDKARMEINNPSLNPTDPYFVTNGLLVVEMVSGRVQTGAATFDQFAANDAQIAGDSGSDAPAYSALKSVAAVGQPNEYKAAPLAPGTVLPPLYINRQGTVTQGTIPQNYAVRAAGFMAETGHNLADVFVTYMNSQAPVFENGIYVNGPLMNWVSAVGYPVTEPYWTSIKVSGKDRLMLFQAFQRRVLTYSPENPDGWKVEMGNVGAQYYTWRYLSPAPLVCQRVPVRGFGRVWADHRSVQRALGCPQDFPPFDKELAVQSAYQTFEHGTMLWISRTTFTQERIIYAFFDDGTFQQFDDTWREGQPPNAGLTPPAGLYEPQRGFGKVWREGTGARVRERLGWATAAEKGAAGAYQRFQSGEMYWTGTANKIFVLYGTVADPRFPNPTPTGPFRYDVFDDAFTP